MSLTLIVGPVAVGKTTVRQRLINDFNLMPFKTCTTRNIRDEEKLPGMVPQYHFLSGDQFEENVKEKLFHEFESFAGSSYGTLKRDLQVALEDERHWVGIVDIRGAINLKRDFPQIFTVFIAPSSVEELESRAVVRGSETKDERMERLRIALERELPMADHLDAVVKNVILEDTVKEVYSNMQKYFS